MDDTSIFSMTSLLLAAVLCLSCVIQCDARMSLCNGDKEYNVYDQICCGGEPTQKIDMLKCCDDRELYYSNSSMCCGGSVLPFSEEEHICCAGEKYAKSDYMCCADTPVKLTQAQKDSRDTLECCSTLVIDLVDEFCCGGEDYNRTVDVNLECCNGEIMHKVKKYCHREGRILNLDEDLCSGEVYSTNKASCCGGVLNTTFPVWTVLTSAYPDFRCCDHTVPYRPSQHDCCPSTARKPHPHLIPKDKDLVCCGDSYYNRSSNSQACLNDKRVDLTDNQVLCGRHVYEKDHNHDCCGSFYYNNQTEQCCKGLYGTSVIPKTEKCCNGKGLNSTSLCCKGHFICNKENDEDDDCCINMVDNRIRTYCSKKQKCNGGEIVPLPPGDNMDVCGRSQYSTTDEICCGRKKASLSLGYNSCCMDEPYNNLTQQCCARRVIDVPVSQGKCCVKDGHVYGFKDETNPCLDTCHGSGRKFDPETQTCCGGKPIDRSKRKCCNDNLSVKIGGEFDCCGAYKIKTSKRTCCAHRFSISLKSEKCCHGVQPYRPKQTTCDVGGQVTPKKRFAQSSDVERVCYDGATRKGEGLVQAACRAKYALRVVFDHTAVDKRRGGAQRLDIFTTSVRQLSTREQFTPLIQQVEFKHLRKLLITVPPNGSGRRYKCRGILGRGERKKETMLVLLNKKPRYGSTTLELEEDDFVYFTKYTRKTQRKLSELQPTFCNFLSANATNRETKNGNSQSVIDTNINRRSRARHIQPPRRSLWH